MFPCVYKESKRTSGSGSHLVHVPPVAGVTHSPATAPPLPPPSPEHHVSPKAIQTLLITPLSLSQWPVLKACDSRGTSHLHTRLYVLVVYTCVTNHTTRA